METVTISKEEYEELLKHKADTEYKKIAYKQIDDVYNRTINTCHVRAERAAQNTAKLIYKKGEELDSSFYKTRLAEYILDNFLSKESEWLWNQKK